MRALGDQWIEIIDGQKHMVKAVAPIELCKGCCFNCNQGGCCWKGFDDCQMGSFFIIKDLGILNDGFLSCPFCGEYTEILKGKLGYRIRHVCRDSYVMAGTAIYETKQKAIESWNRRA